MPAPPNLDPRALRSPEVLSLLAEINRRDDCRKYEGSLAEFIKGAWPVVEQGVRYLPNWHIDAVAAHLESVSRGEIRRLILNLPPRSLKSITVSICWLAWTWAQSKISYLSGPQVRFLCASYNDDLALDLSRKRRRLITSPWYQERWGHKFTLTGDLNTVHKFDNDKGGRSAATSVKGTLLGIGGDVIVCFPYEETILTENGQKQIGDLVENQIRTRVWSYNARSDRMELRPITGWHRNPGRPLVRVELKGGGSVTCTADHQFRTLTGYCPANLLRPGYDVLTAPSGMVFPTESVVGPTLDLLSPGGPGPDALDSSDLDAISGCQNWSGLRALGNFSGLLQGQFIRALSKSSVFLAVRDILRPSSVAKTAERWIRRVAVNVSDLLAIWAWSEEGERDKPMHLAVQSLSVLAKRYARVAISNRVGHYPWAKVVPVAGDPAYGSDATQRRDFIESLKADYWRPTLGIVSRVVPIDHVPASTYCVTVEHNGNMVVGQANIIAKNCDDPHNLEQVESDSERFRAINFWKEITTTRLNTPEESAVVLCMQRLHSNDLTGYWLDQDREGTVTALILPMEHDVGRHCVTVLKWDYVEDDAGQIEAVPLKTWEDPRTVDGELLHPERVGYQQLELMKRELGPYLSSGRLQQAPVPSGGGIFNINDWMPWPPEGYPMPKQRKGEEPSIDLPPVEFVLASLDTAFDSKKENDYHALTIWGVWRAAGAAVNDPISRMSPNAWSHRLQSEPWILHGMTPEQWAVVEQMKTHPAEEDRPKAVLMYAWHKRLALHGPPEQRPDGLTNAQWNSAEMRKERGKQWGLVEWVVDSCRRYHVNRLIIEASASAFQLNQELQRIYSSQGMVVEMIPASGQGDKVARAYSVQHLFTDRLIYAPFFPDTGEPILWLRTVLDEMGSFPKGKNDDIVDSAVRALRWLRDHGLIARHDEFEQDWIKERTHTGRQIPLYPM